MSFKLKNEIIRLPNADKDGGWIEHWSKETHGLDILVHPFKCALIGRPGSGKSTIMHNLFLRIQLSNKPFQTLIVIQPSTSKEHEMLDPTLILTDIPDIESLVRSKSSIKIKVFPNSSDTKPSISGISNKVSVGSNISCSFDVLG